MRMHAFSRRSEPSSIYVRKLCPFCVPYTYVLLTKEFLFAAAGAFCAVTARGSGA